MINLSIMQNKVDKLMSVFTNIVNELNIQIIDLNVAIDDNNARMVTIREENKQYAEKINEYQALKDKVESIIK